MKNFPDRLSEIMRAKRPYLYSDSENTDAYRLSRSEFSHYLDTLTDRNQHKDFEIFARKICEREICPNLRPQTGPEGGGDGKVDTESYPVDETISERWFTGKRANGAKAGFGFSAKAAWTGKVRSDVKGIVETGRGYEEIFFVTSRPTRAKDRLRIEDELRNSYGVPVTILDREWLIDRVFTHNHKDIAFDCLGAGEHDPNSIKLGPNDFKNQQALADIEDRLMKMGTSPADYTQAISDSFEAASLSRRLEKPRYETEGRFQRAIDFAKKYGATHQLLRAVYESAWTRFWWFDDVEGALELYERVEEIAFATDHAHHISKVCNLQQLIVGRVVQGLEDAETLRLAGRSSRLKAKLTELSEDNSRPNNALYAETLLRLHQLNEMTLRGEHEEFDSVWVALSDITDRAKGLGEFPADMLNSVIDALSPLAPESEAFDELVEKLAEFMAARSQELTAGRIYLTQGERKLGSEKPIDAIKWLGRSVVNFMKEESREEQARALYCLSVAYRGAGLLWAARGAAMGAVTQVCALAEADGEIPIESIPTFSLFASIALELGHVADFLCGIQYLNAANNFLPLDEASHKRLSDKILELDHLCACMFVGLADEEIARLTEFPDILEELHLFTARLALLYRLGHLDLLKADGSIPEETSDSDIQDMMSMLAAQPASRDLPKQIVLLDSAIRTFDTRIMGIGVRVSAAASLEGFLLAEAHISFVEAFISTLLNSGAYPHRESLQVDVQQSEDACGGEIEFAAASGLLTVTLPKAWNPTEVDTHVELNDHLVAFGCHVLTTCLMMVDHEKTLEELIGIERAFERATMFCRTDLSP